MTRLIAAAVVAAALAGCTATGPSIAWREHRLLRAPHGPALHIAEPHDLEEGAFIPRVHYLGFSVERALLPQVGVPTGARVVLATIVEGIGAEPVHLLSRVRRARPGGVADFTAERAVTPTAFAGRDLGVTFELYAVEDVRAGETFDRVDAAGGRLSTVNPGGPSAAETRALYQALKEAGALRWRYSVALRATKSTPSDALLAGRQVVLLVPPPEAAGLAQRVTPALAERRLALRNDDVVWADQRAYRESPYIVVSLQRHRRHPGHGLRHVQHLNAMEAALAAGDTTRATAALDAAAQALAAETALVEGERAFLADVLAAHRARIAFAAAYKLKGVSLARKRAQELFDAVKKVRFAPRYQLNEREHEIFITEQDRAQKVLPKGED